MCVLVCRRANSLLYCPARMRVGAGCVECGLNSCFFRRLECRVLHSRFCRRCLLLFRNFVHCLLSYCAARFECGLSRGSFHRH